MLADIVILSTDIFAGSANLAAADVVMTIFDGKVVYRRAS
jgi:predicted amidohydrolase YtcJ